MIDALAFVDELTRSGVELSANGQKLRCRGPEEVLTPEVLARLKDQKAVILRALMEADSLTHPIDCPCIACSCPPPRYAHPIPSNVVSLAEYRRRKASAEVAS